jgi:hypothetical protein
MPQPTSKQFSGIFVSYRRDDSSGHAGRLFDRLVNHFGKDRIFMDIDTIEPGEDFVTVIENAVGSCEILIAIIGRNWLSGTGGTTGRLDNPNDFVRVEIATALRRDIRVIPVLVQRATMPKPQDLPDDLAKLSRRNAIELTDARWQTDVDQLLVVMERILAKRDEERRRAQAEEIFKQPDGGGQQLASREAQATNQTTPSPSPAPRQRIRPLYLVLGMIIVGAVLGGLYAYVNHINRAREALQTDAGKNSTGEPSPTPTTAAPGIENKTTAADPGKAAGNSNNSNSVNASKPGNSNLSTRVSVPKVNEAAKPAASSRTGEAERQRKALNSLEESQRQQRAINALDGGKPAKKPSP